MFCDVWNSHFLIYSDNTNEVNTVNKMGTYRSWECNAGVYEICVTHIPGIENTAANKESRRDFKNKEWMLNKETFRITYI